jgi:hypothetical protein
VKISSIPKSGREGSVVYFNGRYGKVVRPYVRPRDPRTPDQLRSRENFAAVCQRWGACAQEQRVAWRIAAAKGSFVAETGRRVHLNGYAFFVRTNLRRADLGLPQFDLPPAQPVFGPNPVAELVVASTGGAIALKLRALSPPIPYILVQGAAPVRTAVRCVQHYTFLGLLPPPTDGWSDITPLYVARYGVPRAGTAVWIRTCQHIDGWIDVPKVFRARVLAPAA